MISNLHETEKLKQHSKTLIRRVPVLHLSRWGIRFETLEAKKAPNVPLPDQISPLAASTTQDHGRGSAPKTTDTGTRTGGSPTASTHAGRGAKPPLNRTWHFIRLLLLSLCKLGISYLQREVVIEWIVYHPMDAVFGGGEGSEAMLGCLE